MTLLQDEWKALVQDTLHYLTRTYPPGTTLFCSHYKKPGKRSTVPDVVIIVDQIDELHNNIAKAIKNKGITTLVIEANKLSQHKKWQALLTAPDLKFLLCEESALRPHPEIYPYYSKGEDNLCYLAGVPLVPLHSPDQYNQEQKAVLWNLICTLL